MAITVAVYLFLVEGIYMNFPNLRESYYWPKLLKNYIGSVQQRRAAVKVVPIVPISRREVRTFAMRDFADCLWTRVAERSMHVCANSWTNGG